MISMPKVRIAALFYEQTTDSMVILVIYKPIGTGTTRVSCLLRIELKMSFYKMKVIDRNKSILPSCFMSLMS